jgi:large subunit ribosomal protein L4
MAELTAPLFTADGKAKGEVALDAEIFGIEPNMPVLHQVVTAQLAAKRVGSHSTKTRAEVRGGGRKPWRQKGLGRARHGSIRSPQWVGGGVAHGPKPRNYKQRTPKKMKRLAVRSALSARASESAVMVVEAIDWTEPKTKKAKALLASMGATGKTLVVVGRNDDVATKSFRNLPQIVLAHPGRITAYDVLWASNIVFTTDTLPTARRYEVAEDDFVKEQPAAPSDDGRQTSDDTPADSEKSEVPGPTSEVPDTDEADIAEGESDEEVSA